MIGLPLKIILSIKSYGFKKMMNPAINAAAMAMMTTQTQMEALASLLSSISITSLVATRIPIEKKGNLDENNSNPLINNSLDFLIKF
jgi:hypothetical protein